MEVKFDRNHVYNFPPLIPAAAVTEGEIESEEDLYSSAGVAEQESKFGEDEQKSIIEGVFDELLIESRKKVWRGDSENIQIKPIINWKETSKIANFPVLQPSNHFPPNKFTAATVVPATRPAPLNAPQQFNTKKP